MIVKNPFEIVYEDADLAFVAQIKSHMTILIVKKIREDNLKQREVAKLLRVSQSRVSNLINGRLDKFSIDMLIIFMRRMGITIAHSFDPHTTTMLNLSVKEAR